MNNIKIGELAARTRQAQEAMGLSLHTVWNQYTTALLPIVKLHKQEGWEYFERRIVDEYISRIEGRWDRGEIGVNYYSRLLQGG